MKKDWSKKSLWTGFVVSTLALMLHSSGAVSMDAFNPLALSGCATPSITFQAPSAPDGGVSSHDINLKKGKRQRGVTLARGTKVYVVTESEKYGPLLTYGVDDERRLLFASRASGQLMAFAFDEIRRIQLVKESKAGAGAGWGGLAGGILGAAIGASSTGKSLAGICGAVIGTPVGATVGGVAGAIAGQDKNYRFGSGKWRIHSTRSIESDSQSMKVGAPESENAEKAEVPKVDTVESDGTVSPDAVKKSAPSSGNDSDNNSDNNSGNKKD